MGKRFRFGMVFITILAGLFVISGCGNSKKEGGEQPVLGTISQTGNVQASIQSAMISSGTNSLVVTFTLLDENGAPLDPNTVVAAGGRCRLFVAQIDATGNYKNYIYSSSGLPTNDSGGTFATVGSGLYTYTFGKNITTDAMYDATRTHTVAIQIRRDVASATGGSFRQTANPYFNFRPDGNAVTVTREVVSTSACNACHGTLNAHGGRKEVALCILCHNPGVIDPDTGNSVDFKSMIHKIHMGAKLPSNAVGGDYTIGSASFKTVGYPLMSQDSKVANTPVECTKCHKAGTDSAGRSYGNDVDKWKTNPTREKCTTCHDLTSFNSFVTTVTITVGSTPTVTAATQHTGGNMIDDSICAGCHTSTGANDYSDINDSYSAPIPSVHLVLEQSAKFTGINFQILSVTNATAGNSPVVTFRITDDGGNALSPAASGSSYSLKLGYMPAADYTNDGLSTTASGQPISQTTGTYATDNGDGSYTITFATPIPAGLTGVGGIGMEGRATFTNVVTTPHKGTISPRIGGKAIQYYFDLTTGAQVTDPARQRRVVVDVNKCNVCHGRLSLHGGNRVNSTQQCVICHNPNATAEQGTPEELPVNFKHMIHSIHRGEALYSSGTPSHYAIGSHDYAEVRYPSDLRNCLACHIESSSPTFGFPLPAGVLGTTVSAGTTTNDGADNTRMGALSSSCLSCHDDPLSTGHAGGKIVSGVETCTTCHSNGLLLSPQNAHLPAM